MNTSTIILILAGLISLPLVLIAENDQRRVKKMQERLLQKLADEGISPTLDYQRPQGIIGVDGYRRKLFIIKTTREIQSIDIINYSDIIDCELIIDDEVVFKHSKLNTDNELGGGVGKLVSLSPSSRQIKDLKIVKLNILVRKTDISAVTFIFYEQGIPLVDVASRLIKADEWKNRVSGIIELNQKSR